VANQEKIIIGSDHGGYELKEFIKEELDKKGIPFEDIGTNSTDSVDYPNYGARAARKIANGDYKRGILICGTGIGISITANRFKGVRAALCCSVEMARMSREHNNANILALGGRTTNQKDAAAILETWLSTPFEGGRHERRVGLIDELAC
jgi:ribose 5-phosphate isomerase B